MIFKHRSFSQVRTKGKKIGQQFPFRGAWKLRFFLDAISFMHDKIPSKAIPLFIRLISFRTVNGKRRGSERVQFGTQTRSMLGPSWVSLTSKKNQDEFSCNRLVKLSSAKLGYIFYKENFKHSSYFMFLGSYQIKQVTTF